MQTYERKNSIIRINPREKFEHHLLEKRKIKQENGIILMANEETKGEMNNMIQRAIDVVCSRFFYFILFAKIV